MASPTDAIARSLAEIERLASPESTPPTRPTPQTPLAPYAAATRTATYGFLAALPLLVVYEVGIVLANRGTGQIRVGADVWIKNLLAQVGLAGWMALGGVVLLIGLAVLWAERERRPPLRGTYFVGLVAESFVYAVVLAFLVGGVVGALFGNAALEPAALAQFARLGLPLQLALSIGAGLYEELVFRVLLVGGLFLVARRLMDDRRKAYVVAAVIGAAVFSLVHHLGPYGDPFSLQVFTFRFLFGLALNGVFLLRGFALAAWTHALYDVLVVMGGV